MNVSTLEAPVDTTERTAGPRSSTTQRPRALRPATPSTAPARPGRRTGRGTGPAARPARRPGASPVVRTAIPAGRSCTVAAPTPAPSRPTAPSTWRLTDRGIALVLVTGLLIATAALAVVGLTAVRVTSEHYHHGGGSALVQPAS